MQMLHHKFDYKKYAMQNIAENEKKTTGVLVLFFQPVCIV